jgi:hypothetical protein
MHVTCGKKLINPHCDPHAYESYEELMRMGGRQSVLPSSRRGTVPRGDMRITDVEQCASDIRSQAYMHK